MSERFIFDSISPADLGLPAKFATFRRHQRETLEWLTAACEQPVSAGCLPTGSGKTAIAAALAQLLNVKAVYLVATKQLQTQVLKDFASMGMVDIRGRANYRCPNYGDCERGYDEDCSVANTSGCAYANAVDDAKRARLIVTNYAYWLHARKHNSRALELDGCPVELLICDEFHDAEKQLGSFASVKLYASELGRGGNDFSRDGVMSEEDPENWKGLAKNRADKLAESNDEDEQDLADRYRRVTRMNSNWVWQFDDRGHVTFEPIRLNPWMRTLFSGVPRVLLMSASLNQFTLKLLMPQDTLYDYRAWDQVFPASNAPVYHIPTKKLSWRSTDEDYQEIVAAMDKVIDQRLDRKGIVHTVSYARTRQALHHSRHARRFIWNESGSELAGCLDRFRSANRGALLLTPSVEQGFDFPGVECEHQHFLKFPFPNETQRVVKERCAQIPGYRLHHAAQRIYQMVGRARRYETDRCENFVYDNAVRRLCGPEGRSYCPPGFRIFTVLAAPPPPPRIRANESAVESVSTVKSANSN
jgi:Rad3-related DNA helicase